jgi:hypothetical protein
MFKDEDYFKIIAWLLGVGGVLSALIGGLIAFIFKEHISDNICSSQKIIMNMKEYTTK